MSFSTLRGSTNSVAPKRRAIASLSGFVSTPMIVLAPASARLHDVQTDAAESEHDDGAAALDLRCEQRRAQAGRRAAADVANRIERRVVAHLGDRVHGQHRVLRERAQSHSCVTGLPPSEKRLSRGRRRANASTHKFVFVEWQYAHSALWNEENDVIADFELRDARPALDDHASGFVSENRRKLPRHLPS